MPKLTAFFVVGLLLSPACAVSARQGARTDESAIRPHPAKPSEPVKSDGEDRKKEHGASGKLLTKESRLELIRKAQIWVSTEVSAMDLRAGPQGAGAFMPDELITCDYVETKKSGSSRKFDCTTGEGRALRVRYGADNGEVQGSVVASRLLWALGFSADRVYPVRVRCRGCSSDPWTKREKVAEEHEFDSAVIELRPEGREMKSDKIEGWAWPELALVDEAQGGATLAQRDALRLLAVLIQHTDSKAQQQRLLCLPGGTDQDGRCEKPFMGLHDVGLTFGRANFANRTTTGSVNFHEWARTPVWRDAAACVGHLDKSTTGTLEDPKISEAGRAFLAGLLVQLNDQQLVDLFAVAHVDRRSRRPNGPEPPASVLEWVTAFKQKRAEVVDNHCPA